MVFIKTLLPLPDSPMRTVIGLTRSIRMCLIGPTFLISMDSVIVQRVGGDERFHFVRMRAVRQVGHQWPPKRTARGEAANSWPHEHCQRSLSARLPGVISVERHFPPSWAAFACISVIFSSLRGFDSSNPWSRTGSEGGLRRSRGSFAGYCSSSGSWSAHEGIASHSWSEPK